MQAPPFPPDEKARQDVLEKLKILDTPREERFDRIVRLAAQLLDVPISAISLVDGDRQWFKSSVGLPVEETTRDVSFCGHTILQDRALVVEDAEQDPRFADNPLVADDPGIRFYAGQPLRVDGMRIGALCVVDRRPRCLTEDQLASLKDLRDLAERELELDDINVLRERIGRERQQKKRVEHELEQFFSLPIDLLCVAHPDGTFKRLSSAWSTTLGWTQDEMTGQQLLEFIHEDDRGAATAETMRLSEGGRTVAFETRFRHRDGSHRWLLWNAIGSAHDDLIYAAARDISELKRMQAMKDEFVSTVSHELRTPLTSIRGSLDLLAHGVGGELPSEAAPLVQVARSNCLRLAHLINDILDIEKIEAGKLTFELENHPLVALVERALEDNAQYASTRSVSFRLTETIPEISQYVDADRVHQVLTNLLSNAAKYEPEGGTVEVAIGRRGPVVRVSVSDHGPGIPEGFRERVFEKFAQADGSDRRKKGGTGLGLSIARAIVERMGGRIGFDTATGEGTTFWFELGCQSPQPGHRQPGESSPRVLVCEDDVDVAEILKLTLEHAGYAVDVALTLAAARTLLESNDYHAATVDLVLPDGEGFSLIREVRENPNTQKLPLIVVSARADEGRKELNGGSFNVVDWLSKPIDQGRLLASLRQAAESCTPDKPRILHVEDDPGILTITAQLLGDVAEIVPAPTISEAESLLERESFGAVILDWRLPDGVASRLLPAINERHIPVLVFSAHDIKRDEIEAVAEVLVKSQVSNEELRSRILTLVGEARVAAESGAR